MRTGNLLRPGASPDARRSTALVALLGHRPVVGVLTASLFAGLTPAVASAARPALGRLSVTESGAKTVIAAPLAGGAPSSEAVRLETLATPPRLVIDLLGVDIQPRWQRLRVGTHGIKRARAATRPEGTRIVLDLDRGARFPEVAVDVVGARLEIGIMSARPEPVTEAPEASDEPLAHAVEPQVPEASPASPEPPAPVRPDAPSLTTKPEEVSRAPDPAAGASRSGGTASPARVARARGSEAQGDPRPGIMAERPGRPSVEQPRGDLPLEGQASVENVRFEPKDGFYRLTIDLEEPAADLDIHRTGPESAPILRVRGASLPSTLERTMDVSAVAGETLTAISTFNDRGDLIISARIEDDTEHRHWKKGRQLMWDFRSKRPRVATYEEESTASYGLEAARSTRAIAAQRARYTGRRISLDLKDADIQNVLRLLADVSKLNIVASDDVKGKITIKLRNVPWDQALDIILRAKQLDKTRNGNIIRVAPIETLRREEELRIARLKAQVELEPLTVRLIPISYAVAKDVAAQLGELLTPRGSIRVDARTNVLIVEDIAEILTKIERLVRTLDTQTPQVLIEARIVEARSSFSRELGIQWGGTANFNRNFGNQTGLTFPSNIRIAGAADDVTNQVTEGVLPNADYAINLPAAVGAGGGGAIGFIFGSLNNSALLNLRLSAAEAIGKLKIVSAPKVVTLDNRPAKIVSGERVPITVLTANGPTTRFVSANIELIVRPHVTQDGSVLMDIEAKKNGLSDRVDLLGVPGILTKEAKTEMIVRDGDTAVLGGLYQRSTAENEAYVPWIGKIPVLGWLFKTTSQTDARDELLIFISPRIVNRSAALISTE